MHSIMSNRIRFLAAVAALFVTLCFVFTFNRLDYAYGSPPINHPETRHRHHKSESNAIFDDKLRELYLSSLYQPTIGVDSKIYNAWGMSEWELSKPAPWKQPLGERFCVIDIDNREFDQPGQAFHEKMTWSQPKNIHGLSTGLINHWLYAKVHGYAYHYIHIDELKDRRSSWKKPDVIAAVLRKYKYEACVYMDSDAIFHHLDLPFEWLMNYWDLDPTNNSLAMAFDPKHPNNEDKFGKVFLNTGFIVAQNNPKTFEILKAWSHCPDDDSLYPGCSDYRTRDRYHLTDQGGFGTYIRYEYPDFIKELPCTEANGFPESGSGCDGSFIKHLWTGKTSWLKAEVGKQLPGKILEIFHEQFLVEKDSFFLLEKNLVTEPAAGPGVDAGTQS